MPVAFSNHLAGPLRYVKVRFAEKLKVQISSYLQPTPPGVRFRGRVVKSLRILATVICTPIDTRAPRRSSHPTTHPTPLLTPTPFKPRLTTPTFSTVISKSPYRRQGVSFLTQGANTPGRFPLFVLLLQLLSFLDPQGDLKT